jgi:hypothetical protein
MEHNFKQDNGEVLKIISKGRERTSYLWKYEQNALAFLVQRIPSWISSDMLTYIGFGGSVMVFLSFILAAYVNENYLLLGMVGLSVNWFGDSLDGRLAYYRHKPRKWYGFSFDLIIDWMTIIIICWGYIIYVEGIWEILGVGFVVMYAWAMMIALIRYKVTGQYSIDSGILGPTEVRILVAAILVAEVLFKGSVIYSSATICVVLFISDIFESRKLLKLADLRDKEENDRKLPEKNI